MTLPLTIHPIDPRNGVIRGVFLYDALGWGLVLLQPGSTFGLSHSFDGMAALMGEEGWAGVFIAWGALIFLSFHARGWLRVALTFGIGVGHFLLALTFAQSSALLSPGVVTHTGLLALAFWLLGQDFRRRHV